jgi:hypothetical protein
MLGSGTFRLEPPRLRTNEDPASERHATWYELFFDLVFAAAVIELTTALADDPTSAVFGRFAGSPGLGPGSRSTPTASTPTTWSTG